MGDPCPALDLKPLGGGVMHHHDIGVRAGRDVERRRIRRGLRRAASRSGDRRHLRQYRRRADRLPASTFWLSVRAAQWADPWLGGWRLPVFWRGILRANYADLAKVTPSLVHEWTDLNNRAQLFPHRARPAGYVPFAGTPADLPAIHVPALLLWSDHDPEVPLEVDGRQALQSLGSVDKQLTVTRHCGHMMPLECGPKSVAVARRALDRLADKDQARSS